jgi:hypothetical protein
MNLRIKFAQVCRKILTPLRKYLIIKKIKSRIKAEDIRDRKDIKFVLHFIKSNSFGVILALQGPLYNEGFVLRCGCYVLDYHAKLTRDVIAVHKTMLEHGIRIHKEFKEPEFMECNIPSSGILQYATIVKPVRTKPRTRPTAQR